MAKKKQNILIFSTVYALLIYLLYHDLDTLRQTKYFNKNVVPPSIIKRFPFSITTYRAMGEGRVKFANLFSKIVIKLWHLFYFFIIQIRFSFREVFHQLCFYTNDVHTYFCFNAIRNHPYVLIEDGVGNYLSTPPHQTTELELSFKGRIFHSLIYTHPMENNRIKTLLTQPHPLLERKEIISLGTLWKNSSQEKKQLIKDIFGLEEQLLKILQGKTSVLFTQPLSEDALIHEEEKINLYRSVIESEENLVIKKHPRETTDYKKFFPNCFVFEAPIPSELLTLCGVRFKKAFTVSSTAALNFDYPVEVIPIKTKIKNRYLGEDTFLELLANKYR